MSTTAEARTVTIGRQLLRVAIRPGQNEPGRPPRVPLLLINGIGANLELLAPFVAALDPAVEVIRFDPPGIGGSPRPAQPYWFSGLCRLIARMLTELGYDQVDVLGISWGGGVAQHFAAFQAARCRRLVLVATATGTMMLPARPSVLARLVTPRRYLDRELPAADRGRHLRRAGENRLGRGLGGHAPPQPGRGIARLPVPARRFGGLDQRDVPASAAPAHAHPGRR